MNFDTDYEVVSVRSGLTPNPDSSPAFTQDRVRVPIDFVPRGNATIRRGEYTMIRVGQK